MTIFVILLIYKFIKGTFEYEKVTRFELIIIPVYSAIMMVLVRKRQIFNGRWTYNYSSNLRSFDWLSTGKQNAD